MAASPERIREVIEQYVARVAGGTTDEVMELYAEGATVEDPVGTEVKTTPEAIRATYCSITSRMRSGLAVIWTPLELSLIHI